MDKQDKIFAVLITFMIVSAVFMIGFRITNIIPDTIFKLYTLAMSITSLGYAIYINKQIGR